MRINIEKVRIFIPYWLIIMHKKRINMHVRIYKDRIQYGQSQSQ
jgi:hypothetical protein